jgi:hypothetical protein
MEWFLCFVMTMGEVIHQNTYLSGKMIGWTSPAACWCRHGLDGAGCCEFACSGCIQRQRALFWPVLDQSHAYSGTRRS